MNKKIISFSLISGFILLSGCASNAVNPRQPHIMVSQISPHSSNRYLHENYVIKNKTGLFRRNPTWMPAKVYDDGVSVYIIMSPQSIASLPKLYIYNQNNKLVSANYQTNKHYYRVDYLFDKALLIKQEERVAIFHQAK